MLVARAAAIRTRFRTLFPSLTALATTATLLSPGVCAGDAPADASAQVARAEPVVARVGPLTATVGEIEARLARVPAVTRAEWGTTADAVRRGFVNDVVVPQALLLASAEAQSLATEPPASYAIERARSNATLRALRARVGPAAAISADDVRAYYDQHQASFDSPDRIGVWRILCATREDALAVLDALKADASTKAFTDLARIHSLDKGTSLRGGDLGLLTDDGMSPEPGLRADPAVMRAVRAVHDGDIIPSPVPEGTGFAVVWRRGSLPARQRTLAEVAPAIRDAIWKDRIKDAADQLLANLRAARVRDVHEDVLVAADIPADDGPATRERQDASAATVR
jgi:peptidyl-prolyl cis-trans isomerase C